MLASTSRRRRTGPAFAGGDGGMCIGAVPATHSVVMPVLDAGIHDFIGIPTSKVWMAGTSPAMTGNAADAGLHLAQTAYWAARFRGR
ncbi:hypothetical protein [Bradyrhizobium sp. WD16]|uniref:hypothetical protein n=1 Tax=Bradyrhizobium sp. WD16 TaxID=1521768 RepID=UPI0020A26F30|nr:hypothetical protein [Bradyrhizobium sp. WD16]